MCRYFVLSLQKLWIANNFVLYLQKLWIENGLNNICITRKTSCKHDLKNMQDMQSKVTEICRMPMALISPAPGFVYDALLPDISFWTSDSLVAVGNLRITPSAQDTGGATTGAAATGPGEAGGGGGVGDGWEDITEGLGFTTQVLLVPPKSDLFSEMLKIRAKDLEHTRTSISSQLGMPSSLRSQLAAHAETLELKLFQPLEEGELLMIRLV